MVNWHKFFTSILDTISDGVFISDAMGTTLYVNQMYADLVGVPARDLRGKNVRDLVSEGFFDLALNPEVVRTGKPAIYMQKLKDGKNVVISGAPVFDDKGRVCLVVTFVRDETRLAELNEQTGEQRKLIKEINDKLAFVAQSQGRDLEPVFASSAMQSVAMELKRYASTDATVLIMGETGVGKDVFARLTHRWSRRKDKILLKVDCGGISETLTESEIFGYVPGAFTGASSKGKPGYFEIADGSTIFLDEVGELPLSMQTRLLRVLQDNEIVRVGSSQPRKVDVRIIAATNRNLEECVEAGTFRRDLFYRLNVGTVRIPPLRERPETYACWRSSSCASTPQNTAKSWPSWTSRWTCWPSTAGRATCANCRTWSTVWSSPGRGPVSRPATCRPTSAACTTRAAAIWMPCSCRPGPCARSSPTWSGTFCAGPSRCTVPSAGSRSCSRSTAAPSSASSRAARDTTRTRMAARPPDAVFLPA